MQLLLIAWVVSSLLSNVVALSIPTPPSITPYPHSPVNQPFSKVCIKCYNICHNTFMKCAFVCHNSFSLYCEVSDSRSLICHHLLFPLLPFWPRSSSDQWPKGIIEILLLTSAPVTRRFSHSNWDSDKHLCRSSIGLHRDRTIHLRSLPSLLASLPPSGEPHYRRKQHDYASKSTTNTVEHIIGFGRTDGW